MMRHKNSKAPRAARTGLALACVALTLASPALAQQAPDTLVVTAARLFDASNGRLIENPQIVIHDGRISAVGRAGDAAPEGARRLDLPGMTVLPGLIDMHVHLDSDPSYGGYTGLQFSDRFWSVLAVKHAQQTLQAGFTTVRNVGADAWNDVGLRQAIDEGKLTGPRIVTAAYSFGATGGHCDSTYFPPSMAQKNPYNADSAAEARKSVRELRKYGAQVIKICATGGVFSRNTEPGQQQMSLEEMKAVADEAHQWGLRVAAHAHGAAGIHDAIRAGVDTIEHASLIDEEGIRLAKQHGAWLSMDIFNTDYTQAEGKKNGVLEDNLRKDREVGDIQRENFRRAHAAGVKMVYGTDAGVYPHGLNGKQFAVMTRYGMSPAQAIRAATFDAAQALGRKDVGLIEPGRWGDLIAVAGDPTQDVRLLESVPVVIKGGEVVKDAR
ncbi:amidohydrolase family protein [Lysobacter enzymogenes]|uniref:Amidohydrolase family protein n=1 Tax=Lysobacter enzymogenes TaxID=69 RepID=A0A0S2DAU8_LYSEN|nr:amidohydrolase family protein [Lysobacter enzymogenes]ALN55655.1 amidohydrolase family protein [Lysobacter enzymogenes]